MPTLIKAFLLFIISLSPLPAQELNLSRLPLQETYADSRSVLYEIVNTPESEWFSPNENITEEPDQDLWLKIPLETVQFETDFYLTEHKGLRFWEFFLMKGDSLVHNAQVDWTQPHQGSSYQAILYRGFTYAPVTQYAGEGYVLFIHIRKQYQSQYNFILRSYENFVKNQQTWSLIQGLGLGYFFVILLLSILLIINMKYIINWLFLLLVLFSGLNILFLSGLGPYLTVLVIPRISLLFWFTLMGLFNPAVILYLQSFLALSVEKKGIRYYFVFLLCLSIALSLVPLFAPTDKVQFFVNLQNIFSSLLIGVGLIWLTAKKIRPARWLLAGWFLYLFVTYLGYVLSQMDESRTMISPVCSFLGQGFLVMLFGGAMIMD
uniref:7TM diverse intracellular signaling domain-containing protein n=1 Tax=Oceanispirochaeta sp. TaxID=2035350 RepID=UPI00261B4776